MSDNRKVAADLIIEAADTITNKRPGVHGSAENSFKMIGEMWTIMTRHNRQLRQHDVIMPQDVAQMMVLLKIARASYGDLENRDNFVDGIGYTALAGMLQLKDPDTGQAEAPPKTVDPFDGGTVGDFRTEDQQPVSEPPIGDIIRAHADLENRP